MSVLYKNVGRNKFWSFQIATDVLSRLVQVVTFCKSEMVHVSAIMKIFNIPSVGFALEIGWPAVLLKV